MMEQQGDYITDAMEMLGKGYEPSIEIEAPQTVTQRRGGKLVETNRSAFVKIYTSFKEELKDIDGDDLKVWLYLALSVNRHTNDARPGLRKIAEDTGMAVNTVRAAIERLEAKSLLDVEKADGKQSIYHPSDYVSARRETVSRIDTVAETVSNPDTTVSKNDGTVSTQYRKTAQPEEPELTKDIISDLSIENQIFLGKINITHSKADEIKNALRRYFKLTPRWSSKFDKEWLQWALSENMTADQIQAAAKKWGSDRRFNWQPQNLKGIAEHWLELIEDAAQSVQLDGSALAAFTEGR